MPDEMADLPPAAPESAPNESAADMTRDDGSASASATSGERDSEAVSASETGDELDVGDAGATGADALGDAGADVVDPYATGAPADPVEGAVPPGYDWPTHGGYLGCLLGLVVSCLLTGFLGSTVVAVLAGPGWVHALVDVVVAVAALAGLGRLGWVLGKRYLREYPRPAEAGMPAQEMAMADVDGGIRDDWRAEREDEVAP